MVDTFLRTMCWALIRSIGTFSNVCVSWLSSNRSFTEGLDSIGIFNSQNKWHSLEYIKFPSSINHREIAVSFWNIGDLHDNPQWLRGQKYFCKKSFLFVNEPPQFRARKWMHEISSFPWYLHTCFIWVGKSITRSLFQNDKSSVWFVYQNVRQHPFPTSKIFRLKLSYRQLKSLLFTIHQRDKRFFKKWVRRGKLTSPRKLHIRQTLYTLILFQEMWFLAYCWQERTFGIPSTFSLWLWLSSTVVTLLARFWRPSGTFQFQNLRFDFPFLLIVFCTWIQYKCPYGRLSCLMDHFALSRMTYIMDGQD